MLVEPIPAWMSMVVITVALVIGAISICTSNVVWFRHRVFGSGGTILTFSGIVLIGLSVWGNVQIEGEGWKLNLERMAAMVAENPESLNAAITEAVKTDPEVGKQLIYHFVEAHPQLLSDSIVKSAHSLPVLQAQITNTLESRHGRVDDVKCVFPDSPRILAPDWVCGAPVDGLELSAVGSYRKTSAGSQFQKDQAAAAGRNRR